MQLFTIEFLVLVMSISTHLIQGFKGIATTFDLTNIFHGNCMSQMQSIPDKHVIALNSALWNLKKCGTCVLINNQHTAMVVDQCPGTGCLRQNGMGLDLSKELWNIVTNFKQPGEYPITWSFIPCPSTFVEGPISYCVKNGSNPNWIALQPSNSIYEIKSMQLNGIEGKIGSINAFYFLWEQTGNNLWPSQVTIEVQSIHGEKLKETLNLKPTGCTRGNFQFSLSFQSPSLTQIPTKSSTSIPTFPPPSPTPESKKENKPTANLVPTKIPPQYPTTISPASTSHPTTQPSLTPSPTSPTRPSEQPSITPSPPEAFTPIPSVSRPTYPAHSHCN